MAAKTKRAAALFALFLVVGSGLLAACADSGSIGLPEGAGMLYFYAEW